MATRCLVVFLLFISCLPLKAQVKFELPLQGTAGQDYWIVNHVDHDASTGVQEYACGNKTYDGHQGTDMVIRSFKTMDSGVVVYAMADGVVFLTKDSLYDRSKMQNSSGLGNYVAINHGNEYWAYYGHLKAYTLLVQPGDAVTEGQPIGMVASSGNSTDPHLHIEVYDINSNIVDPFAGTCQTATASLWKTQPAYDTSFIIIDKGFTAYVPHLDTLRERYDIRDIIYAHSDTAINFWIQTQGVRAGDVQRVDWYTPTGNYWFSYSYTTPADYWYSYFWTYINIPPDSLAGMWTAQYFINNQLITSAQVNVVAWAASVQKLSPDGWNIYPNPANTSIKINLPAIAGKTFQLELYDLTGRKQLLYRGSYNNKPDQIPLPDIPTGVYLIQLFVDNAHSGKKQLTIVK